MPANLVCKVLEVIISGSKWSLQLGTLRFVTNAQQNVFAPRAELISGIAQDCVFPAWPQAPTRTARAVPGKPFQDCSQHLH